MIFNTNYKNHKFEARSPLNGFDRLYECKYCKCVAYFSYENDSCKLYARNGLLLQNLTCDEVIIKSIIE